MEILNGKNLILADDDKANIFALTAALEDYGLNIITAETGREAITALKAAGNIDLILMDMMMPEMDGYEAIGVIREMAQYKSLPIIALTARAMRADLEKCLEAGASDYMSKPIDVDALVELMAKWLEKK